MNWTVTDALDIDSLASAIAKKLAPAISLDIDLWSAAEIAAYLKISPRQVTERMVLIPSFPRAIRLPAFGGGRSRPRWKGAEVVAWVERHQEKKRA